MALKRNITITVRLSEKELSLLNGDVQRTGLSREAYIRSLINGYVPASRPSDDFKSIMKHLHNACNNINQIAMVANKTGIITEGYQNELEQLKRITLEIKKAQYKAWAINGNHKNIRCKK